MFSRLTSLLALIPMLLHSILGCCWHHTHECRCEVEGSRVVCQAEVDSCGQDRGDHAACPSHRHAVEADGPDEPANDPCRRVPCEEERCSFVETLVLAAPAGFDLELSWACATFAAGEELTPHAVHVAIQRVSEEDAPPGSHAERRARSQVWLI